MKKAFIDIFTDGDGDWDYSKVIGILGLVMFLGISYWTYGVKNKDFNPIEWAGGWSIVMGVAAGVSKMRDRTVPNTPPNQNAQP